MPYSAVGHSILVLAILAHLIVDGTVLGVGLGVLALVLAWLIESRALTRTTWALAWMIIVLTTVVWGLFFYSVA